MCIMCTVYQSTTATANMYVYRQPCLSLLHGEIQRCINKKHRTLDCSLTLVLIGYCIFILFHQTRILYFCSKVDTWWNTSKYIV